MIAAAIGPVATLLSDVVRRAFPDKTEAARIEASMMTELLKADLSLLTGQLEINKAEATSSSLFVAGWRPAVGWTCAAAYGYQFVLQPFLAFAIGALAWQTPPLPHLDTGALSTVLLGMLGIGGLRTFEKYKGVSR